MQKLTLTNHFNMKQDIFIPAFTIFKEGVTEGFVTILRKEGEVFNIYEKMNKYLYLGYTVKPINN